MGSHWSHRFGCTLPAGLRVFSAGPSVPPQKRHCGRGRGAGGGGGCCRRISQTATKCLFFHFFFSRNSSYSSLLLHTRAWPLTQPNSPIRPETVQVRACHRPTFPSQCPQSQWVHTTPVCLPLCPDSPLRLHATRTLLVLLKACLAGEGAIDLAFSQKSCGRHSRQVPGLGLQLPWFPCWSQGPYCLEALSLLSDFFNVLYNFWSLIFIYAGILLTVHSVPQKLG